MSVVAVFWHSSWIFAFLPQSSNWNSAEASPDDSSVSAVVGGDIEDVVAAAAAVLESCFSPLPSKLSYLKSASDFDTRMKTRREDEVELGHDRCLCDATGLPFDALT